ncbi:MAG: type II toxin-antitoxin system HipA family toxin [Phenylobacterium sp.]|uniref:type II toxin-antitoxin system HipA family toxin n=1 Tax=Phenylobacterium sp. TaxID=1871053 RepID=UPI0017A54C4C|nr:type II toxin-antitoxin system HipA family toxin [Phenylobacterium sp.]MBA4793647.1 type II toxin-antitoxin system HipA family toxin [Phenylobacterium sp.]
MIRSLTVWWDGARVGLLRIDENGDLEFVYDGAWLEDGTKPAISISLPKRPGAFSRRETRPFFAGLLPEETQRDAVAHALGVSRANDFRLLERLGGDVAGALTLWPEGDLPPEPQGVAATEPLTDETLLEVLARLPARPMLAGEEGLRLSLAGAQQKLPIVLVNGRVALPAPGQPSTHILKPAIERLPGTTENEALAMRLAAALGLRVAPVEPRRTGERTYLLVERYDRDVGTDGSIRRLHQEDFCQALGVAPERKYASEGGPIFRDCFDLLRRACAAPAPAVLRLVDAAIFNVLVGNADAHGKNYSLLYLDRGIDFAPLYDLLCTAAYPDVHAKLAMKVGKRSTLEEFTPDTWDDFAKEIGVGAPFVRRRAGAIAGLALERIGAVGEEIAAIGFGGEHLERASVLITERAKTLVALAEGRHLPTRRR